MTNQPDDDLRQLFHAAGRDIQPLVRKPPVREVMARAKHRRTDMQVQRPAPLAAILALGAMPLVVIGAVVIGPAGAGILTGTEQRPSGEPSPISSALPTGPAAIGDATAPPVVAPSAPSAVSPLVDVTVYFADGLLVEDGCRRLTAVTRLVPADDQVTGALNALLQGPRPDERAAGLVNQFTTDGDGSVAAAVTLDESALTAVVDVASATDLAGPVTDCRHDELSASVDRTISQFDSWTATITITGSAQAGTEFLAADPTRPVVITDGDSPDAAEGGADPSAAPSDVPGGAPSGDPSVDPSVDPSSESSR